MSYGFQSFSSSGYAQIDQDYSNYALLQSGTVGTGNNTVYFPAQPVPPLVMVRIPLTATVFCPSMNGSGAVSTSSFYINASAGAEYRVYARVQDMSASGTYGLRVYNGSGAVVFDSGKQVLRIATVGYMAATPTTAAVTLPSPGFQPWICHNPLLFCGNLPRYPANGLLCAISARQNSDYSVTFYPRSFGLSSRLEPYYADGGTRSLMLGQ